MTYRLSRQEVLIDIMRALVSLLYMFYRSLMIFEWKTPEIIKVGFMFSLSVYVCMYVCLRGTDHISVLITSHITHDQM